MNTHPPSTPAVEMVVVMLIADYGEALADLRARRAVASASSEQPRSAGVSVDKVRAGKAEEAEHG